MAHTGPGAQTSTHVHWGCSFSSSEGTPYNFLKSLLKDPKQQWIHHPSWWWLSFDSAFWGGFDACPQGVVVLGKEGSSRATPVLGQPSSWPSTLSGLTVHGCMVEGDAVPLIHFSFMYSYLTLILAAGKIQAKRTCEVLSQYIASLLLVFHWTGLLRNFFFISKLRMWDSFHFKMFFLNDIKISMGLPDWDRFLWKEWYLKLILLQFVNYLLCVVLRSWITFLGQGAKNSRGRRGVWKVQLHVKLKCSFWNIFL